MTNTEFEAVVLRYQNLVYTICYQLVQNSATAEDLAQDTFVAAWRAIDRCPPEHLQAWLARIAANKAKDYLKSAWNRRVQAPGDEDLPEPKLAAIPPGPEQQVIDEEAAADLRGLVHGLKEPYRRVSELYFLEERSPDEIAQALERPAKTVRTQIFRARLLLQKQIEQRRQAGWTASS